VRRPSRHCPLSPIGTASVLGNLRSIRTFTWCRLSATATGPRLALRTLPGCPRGGAQHAWCGFNITAPEHSLAATRQSQHARLGKQQSYQNRKRGIRWLSS
jgi:hypothetical protein